MRTELLPGPHRPVCLGPQAYAPRTPVDPLLDIYLILLVKTAYGPSRRPLSSAGASFPHNESRGVPVSLHPLAANSTL